MNSVLASSLYCTNETCSKRTNNVIYNKTYIELEWDCDEQLKFYADLHAIGTDDIKGSSHARDKLDDLIEALVSNTPGTINKEDQICFGTFAHCGEGIVMLM